MKLRIALVGNPNCGKTTMYNALTGSTEYVGNWPGVTVERKEGIIKGNKDAVLVDLPGIYSLSPYTLEERITRDYLSNEKPDAILNIVDSTNIERSLYLTSQLLEIGLPVVVALNMADIIEKRGDVIDTDKLSAILGCPVLRTSAAYETGTAEVAEAAIKAAETKTKASKVFVFASTVEGAVDAIADKVAPYIKGYNLRWVAVNLFSRDDVLKKDLDLSETVTADIEAILKSCETGMDDDADSIMANARYSRIDEIIGECIVKKDTGAASTSDKIDRIVTNRFLGLPIFFMIMWAVYYISIQSLGDMSIGWTEEFFGFISGHLSAWMESAGVAEWLHALVVDGVIGGVGAVLGFVPQLMLLFLFISFLEDCGYMVRVAFIMDRLFRQFGLSGKSFIPMLVGTGCSVPGIMACRTIENDMDRKMTIVLTPFIPCGAKLPVFALMIATFFPEQAWVGPSMYILGISMVIISGIILKKTKLFGGEPAPFVMELPEYRLPRAKGIAIHTWERSRAFIVKAGTVIFFASGLIWFLQAFDFSLTMVEAENSILASMGKVVAPLFVPLGFGEWRASMAMITGFIAKEMVVATYGVLFGIGEVAEDDPNLVTNIAHLFTPVSAYAFMVFTLLASPCFAALGAIRTEMGSWKWTFFAMVWQTSIAYIAALIIYQVGSRIIG